MRRVLALVIGGMIGVSLYAQVVTGPSGITPSGPTDPAKCTKGQQFFNTTVNALKVCTAPNTWTTLGTASASSLTLNGLSTNPQGFGNDTNVTIVSAGSTHTITWAGTLAKDRQNAATVYNDASNTFSGATTQDFSGISHIKVPVKAGYTPTAIGHVGYDSTANALKMYDGTASRTILTSATNLAGTYQAISQKDQASGYAGLSAGGLIAAAQIPPAAASALGGVNSKDCSATGQMVSVINTDGSITCATPSGGGNVSTSVTLTSNAPVIGTGTTNVGVGAASGSTTTFVTTTDSTSSKPAAGLMVRTDGSGNYGASNVTVTNNTATLTLASGSTLATSGANSITLTSTGPTNVTLPTTGTVAALANGVLHGVMISQGASTQPNATVAGSTGQVLRSGGAGSDPAWSTATYPATTTINQILYSSGANTVTGLATANGGLVNTSGTGVPSVTATPTLGVAGTTAGTLTLSGLTSGTATLSTAADASYITSSVPVNATTGYKIGGASATTGHYLRGNGTNYVDGTIAAADLPAALANSTSVNGTSIPSSATLMTTSTVLASGQMPTLTGDVSNSGLAITVAKVNGIAHGATAAEHSVAVITTANTTATYEALTDCTDSGGNHLNYTAATHSFSCGTSNSGGTPSFATIGGGTSAQALVVGTGGSLTVSGTGTVNATALNGTALSGLATGLLKNTTTTGVPSIAVAADLPAHASRHQNGGNDEIATATAAANAIPKATAAGQLAAGWMPALTGECTTSAGAVAVTCGTGIAHTGVDVNTSYQVTATHLASALPVNQGGTGTTSTLTGLMRGSASAMTAAELSGDATTSGSNAVTVVKVNGVAYSAAPATNTVPVITAANTATYKALPSSGTNGCSGTGDKLLYNSSTQTFSCGSDQTGAGGTVSIVGGNAFGANGIVTSGGGTSVQVPSSGSTLDASGNMQLAGTLAVTSGVTAASFTTTGGSAFSASGAEQAKPSAPVAGSELMWFDSTAHVLQGQDSTNAVTWTTTVPKASRTANQFVTNISATGVQTTAQPVWADFTGQLGVSQGGTGLASGTQGGVLAFTASGTLSSSAALTQYGVLLGGGTGVPTATAAGTTDHPLVGVSAAAPVWSKVVITNPATAATLTLADNSSLITSGGNALTLTTSGTTNVTLPLGTKTLMATDTAIVKAQTPLTTKGDLWVTDGAAMHRLGVGTNGQILQADSTQTDGLKWADPSAGSMVYPSGTGITTVTGGTAWGTTLTAPSGAIVGTTDTQDLTNKTYNKVTITAPATGSTLTIAEGKILTASNSITLAGTDSTTMTFPSTSATIARTDAGNTFTGHQTIEGVTSTGATGTGKFVFDGAPTLVTPVLGVATATSINGAIITATTGGTLTLANSSTLATSGGNSLTLTTSGTTNVTFPSGSVTMMTNPMTTAGDVIYGGTSGAPTRAACTSGFLKGGSPPSCVALSSGDIPDLSSSYVAVGTKDQPNGVAGLDGNGKLALTKLAAQAADTVVANATAGSAAPTAVSIGSCSATGSALQYNTTTHAFGCATGYAPLASPSFTTPTLGVASATSINKVAVTAPATSATLTIADGKTLTVSNSITLAGTDSTTMTFPTTNATIARTDAGQTFTGVQTMTSPALTTPVVTTDIHCASAGGCTLGSAALPASSAYIGGAATNNVQVTGTATAARTLTLPDVTGTAVVAATSTTATQALFATATAGAPAYRPIATTDLPTSVKTQQCEIVWGGTGASNVLQSGDDTIVNNSCFNKTGGTWTITGVYCMADVGSNTVTVNPTYGADGTGTSILTGALTCGSSYAYSATGTLSGTPTIADGAGVRPVQGGTLNAHSIHVLIKYTLP